MKRTAFDASRDQRIANESNTEQSLMCTAHGCPNRWAVSNGGDKGLCSAHAWSDTHLWPQITQEQCDAITGRARFAVAKPAPAYRMTRDEKTERLLAMRDVFAEKTDPRAWVYALKRREESGERLTFAARELWRAAMPRGDAL